MRFPHPLLFARRVTRCRTPDNRIHAIYRSNPLNPKAVWGERVPLVSGATPFLAFENYIVPIDEYLTAFDLSDHFPDDTPPEQITCNVGPRARLWALIERNETGGADHQADLRAIRDLAIVRLYTRLRDAGSTTTPDATRFAALNTTAARMCVSPALVRNVLTEQGIAVPVAKINAGQRAPADREPHRFSDASEHLHKWETLTAIVQYRRNTMRGKTKFILADLDDEFSPGGYPTHCPVTGEEFKWETNVSWYSPNVGRYDIEKEYVSGNVVLMSKLARYLIQGKTVTHLPAILKDTPSIATNYNAWRERYPTAHPLPAPRAPRAPRAKPAKPTKDDITTLKALFNPTRNDAETT